MYYQTVIIVSNYISGTMIRDKEDISDDDAQIWLLIVIK